MRGSVIPAAWFNGHAVRPMGHVNAAARQRAAVCPCERLMLWQACISGHGGRAGHQIGSHMQASRSLGIEKPSNSCTTAGSKLPKGLGEEAMEITTCAGRGDIAASRGRA